MNALVATVFVAVRDTTPEDKNVVAGGWGAVLFVFLIVAGVLLSWSLSRQLRKAKAAKEAGQFDERPGVRTSEADPHPSDS